MKQEDHHEGDKAQAVELDQRPVQACLIPLFPVDGSLTRQLKRNGLKL